MGASYAGSDSVYSRTVSAVRELDYDTMSLRYIRNKVLWLLNYQQLSQDKLRETLSRCEEKHSWYAPFPCFVPAKPFHDRLRAANILAPTTR